jgi:hypothetical protein|tara:strand:- start:938 stop:1696 length:759 start_codon:yes stop_codon:yes gene_type:complete
MAISITFGGVTITGAQTWSQSLENRVEAVTIPRADGELINSSPKRNARIVTIAGIITAATNTLARTALNTLEAAIENNRQNLTLFDDRYLNAVKRSFRPSYPIGFQARVIPYTLDFFCDDPYFYSTSDDSSSNAVSVVAAGDTITVTTTAGNAPTPPILTYTPSGALTICRIQNSNTAVNKYIQWYRPIPTLASGSLLVINMKTKTVTVSGVNGLSDTLGDFWDYAPDDDNQLLITVDAAGTLDTEWTDRWY